MNRVNIQIEANIWKKHRIYIRFQWKKKRKKSAVSNCVSRNSHTDRSPTDVPGKPRVSANKAVKTSSGDRSAAIQTDSTVVDRQEQWGEREWHVERARALAHAGRIPCWTRSGSSPWAREADGVGCDRQDKLTGRSRTYSFVFAPKVGWLHCRRTTGRSGKRLLVSLSDAPRTDHGSPALFSSPLSAVQRLITTHASGSRRGTRGEDQRRRYKNG